MNITIQEHKFSFRSEYDILAPNANYSATRAFFSFNDKLQLKTEDGHVLARIKGHFSPFRSRHDFVLTDGRIYQYRCEKLWKSVFVCEGNGESFRLYEHKGLNYSVFHHDRQIATFVKNRIVIGKGNQYMVRMDADADLAIVLCLVLTVNSSENDDNDSSVTFDFGNLGPEDRPFDKSWEPR
jgi:uncharacterized protein YxjI